MSPDAIAAETQSHIAYRVARIALDQTRSQGEGVVRLIEQAAEVQDRAAPRDPGAPLDVYA